MYRPSWGEFIVTEPSCHKLQFNLDLQGAVALESERFHVLEVDQLMKIMSAWAEKKGKHCIVPRTLRVSLAPRDEKKWHRLMVLYHAKMFAAGQRPVQEFPMIWKYFGRYLLREILADTSSPKPVCNDQNEMPVDSSSSKRISKQPMEFGWDTTLLNRDGQDPDMNGVWRKSDFGGELD